MTGYTVHTGTSDQYASGWDRVFKEEGSGKKSASRKASKKTAKKSKSRSSGKKKS